MFPNKLKSLPHLVQFLDEVFICYISILISVSQEQDAYTAIDKAERICQYLDMK